MTALSRPTGADFSLTGRVAVITGGAGLLGVRHAEAIAAAGGIPVLADLREDAAKSAAADISLRFGIAALGAGVDITDEASVESLLRTVLQTYGRADILVNNAANNPKVEDGAQNFARLEKFPLEHWHADVVVGLTGAFLCAKVFGTAMAQVKRGVIINISSEYGMIAPDQRLYRIEGEREDRQPVKPVTYTVVKAGLHGLTIYLSTYWAHLGVRANTITVGGVQNGQPSDFLERAASRVPMNRMALSNEFQGALVYLCSDAASFVTGANLVVDGGKSVW
jgi:NAD(P)-dependent dehydrogenase (short-subunit alcohol dehydrogenase family)